MENNIQDSIISNELPKKTLKERFNLLINEYRPIFLFLPLILLISSDDVTLIINEVLIVMDFGLEENLARFGLILGVSQIVKAISTLGFGFMADKFQRKKLLLISGLGWASFDLLCGFANNFTLLFIARVCATAFAGAASSVTLSLLADMFSSEERGSSFAIWTAITTVGVAVGSGLASAFNKVNINFDVDISDFADRIIALRNTLDLAVIRSSWQNAFIAFGVLGFIFLIFASFLKEPKRAAKEKILEDVLEADDVSYDKIYSIKPADLKFIWTRKTNFWLIFNFLDTILTGLILGSVLLWFQVELGFDFTQGSMWGYIVILFLPIALLLIWGMFYFPKRGDKMVKNGDVTGRAKMAIFCGFGHLPFLIAGFFFVPDATNLTFFFGKIQATPTTFGLGLFLMGLLVGGGLALEMAVGPLHYSTMIDVNLPEHRSTMIAAAAFIDAFGRAIGSWFGLLIADWINASDSFLALKPISGAIIISILTFGIGSGLLWFPIYKHSKVDIPKVQKILEERKLKLEEVHKEHKEHFQEIPYKE